jgi:predicted RNA-binding protein YlqC (UPF0109 family)
MTTQTEQINDLLRALVETFIDHAHALSISAKEVPGAVYWTMQGHADDYGKLVGKKGAHVNALTLLVASLGTAADQLFTFKLLEPEPAPRRAASPPKQATHYDPRPARELLCRILENLGLGQFAVEAKPTPSGKTPIEVLFEISVRTEEDYRALTVAADNSSEGLSVIAALGTLFRAHANKGGIRTQLEVLRP